MNYRALGIDAGQVVVVGDAMLDRYWHGSRIGVCPEAPVPNLSIRETEDRPGGAANVALNVASLGGRAVLVSVLGQDEDGESLIRQLDAAGIQCDVRRDANYRTIVKLRITARNQMLVRADFEENLATESTDMLRRVKQQLQAADVLILSDYDKGVVSEPEAIIAAAKKIRVPVLVDPKFKDFARFRGASLIKPNRVELQHAVGDWDSEADMAKKCQELMSRHSIDAVLVTSGEDGMTLMRPGQPEVHFPARPQDREVFDSQGAGDTVIAVLSAALSAGKSLVDAIRMSNVAASMVVTRSGTASISGPELLDAMQVEPRTERGILSQGQLEMAVANARRRGETIVFTNGCFDILHAGHVGYLTEAAALGHRLVVAVNGNASVSRLKGEGRPINHIHRRMRIVAGLESVDWVVAFEEDTPEALLRRIQPDFLVKGGDYKLDEVVGADIVKGYGGQVRVLSLVDDCSSSDLARKIQSL